MVSELGESMHASINHPVGKYNKDETKKATRTTITKRRLSKHGNAQIDYDR